MMPMLTLTVHARKQISRFGHGRKDKEELRAGLFRQDGVVELPIGHGAVSWHQHLPDPTTPIQAPARAWPYYSPPGPARAWPYYSPLSPVLAWTSSVVESTCTATPKSTLAANIIFNWAPSSNLKKNRG